MTAPAAPLYTPDILALAVDLAAFPLTGDLSQRGSARSRLCGSSLEVGFALDGEGRISRAGAQVTACAIGQAAAALFLRTAAGRDTGNLAAALAALEDWLQRGGAAEGLPGDLELLAPARAFPTRHGAILLPWQAGLAALSKPATAA